MKNEESFQVVKYSKIYLEDVKELWKEIYDSEQMGNRELLFTWLTEHNPCIEDDSPYYLLLEKNKVIGMVGYMPLDFTIQGKAKRGYMSHDTYLAKQYRGKGLGKILLQGIKGQSSGLAGAIWFNEHNHYLYLKSGWKDVQGFNPFLKIFDPYPFIKRKSANNMLSTILSRLIKIGLCILNIPLNILKFYTFKDIKIVEVNKFGEDIHAFFNSISNHFGIIVTRDQKYLNWKFISKPFNKYKKFIAYDADGILSGYVVMKKDNHNGYVRGTILDILVDPSKPKVFQALICKCIEYLNKFKSSHIEIMCTYPLFIREIKKLGFIRSKTTQPFMVSNWEKQYSTGYISNIQNWYLTYSEADGDAWEADLFEE